MHISGANKCQLNFAVPPSRACLSYQASPSWIRGSFSMLSGSGGIFCGFWGDRGIAVNLSRNEAVGTIAGCTCRQRTIVRPNWSAALRAGLGCGGGLAV